MLVMPEAAVAVVPAPGRKWSPFQEAIFQEAAVGKGHVVVLARAGAGKSTTAEEAIRRVPETESVLFTAFAKKIFQEAQQRFAARPAPNVEIAGINSYGFKVVRRSFPKVQLDKHKAYKLSDGIVGDGRQRGDYGKTAKKALVNTVRMMKETLTYDPDGIDTLMDKYEIDAGADLDLTNPDVRGQFVQNAIRLLEATKADTNRVDFTDQIWFPLILDLPPGRLLYDYVFVDECQDLSAAKLELTLRAVKKDGRIFAIGDDRQAIFGFAGADEEAVPHIITRLRAKILMLTISYRCAISIAEVAKLIVPDFESGAKNPDETPKIGVVEEKHYNMMLREAQPGDFILSRTNAPLVKICMSLLRAGKKAVIAGKEDAIGKALLQLIETAEKKGARTVIELQTWATQWADREVERLLSKRPPREEEAEMVSDKVDCIDALSQGATSIREITEKIEDLFSDEDNETRIVCSSTHKAKGLERERAWVLRNTYMKRPGTQEANLWYVAVTRAKGFLFLVDLPARGEE